MKLQNGIALQDDFDRCVGFHDSQPIASPEKVVALAADHFALTLTPVSYTHLESPVDEVRVQALVEEIEHLRARARAAPFIDTFDLRYANRVKQPQPTTQAVMFCIMDVSGSMDRARKDLAKRFFTLLYLCLLYTSRCV